jgi:hypothetical protein
LFVKMYPFASTMTPEPDARDSSRGRRRKYRSKNSSPKNSLNFSASSMPGPAPRFGVVLTLTTAGMTRPATVENASSMARSMACGSIAVRGCVSAIAGGAAGASTRACADTTLGPSSSKQIARTFVFMSGAAL